MGWCPLKSKSKEAGCERERLILNKEEANVDMR
jgi:hypothetical protein